MKPKTNTIMILLYLVLFVFFLIQLYDLYNVETFTTNKNVINNGNIHSIILSPETNDNNIDTYYGTFVINETNNDVTNGCYIYKTHSLYSNEWKKSKIPKLESNKNIIINNIIYDENKRLMAIGLYYENKKPVYNIYKSNIQLTETEGESEEDIVWTNLGSNINIRNICFDSLTQHLQGINI